MAKLVINPGTPQSREFELKPGTNYVGRAFANDVRIEDNSVSGSHAQIEVSGNSVTVKDLGSTNGTYVNRDPVTEATLMPGQLLRLGGVEVLFEGAPPPAIAVSAVQLGSALPPIGSAAIGAPAQPEISRPVVNSTASVPGIPPVPRPIPGSTTTLRSRPPEAAAAPATTTRAVAEPPVAPPDAPGLIELPTGKSSCKFHPKNPAQWLRQKCNQPFCSLCVATRPTPEGTGYFCRTCGSTCVPVKVKYVATKEKAVKEYSDVAVLLRSIGFGFGAALLAAATWAFLAAFMSVLFMVVRPFLCWGTGALCGYAVKIACQDRPSIIFSLIAVGYCILGVAIGVIAAVIVTQGHGSFGILSVYTLVGLMAGMFTAWKIGGGDF